MAEETQEPTSSAAEPQGEDLQASVADLQKRLNNVTKQRDGLLAQKSAANTTPQSSEAVPSAQPASSASSATPAASSADTDLLKSLKDQLESLQKENNTFKAQAEADKQRKSYIAKAKKDGITLGDDDLDMIADSSDQNATYKYIKGLKANASARKFAPSANVFTRQKDNVGASIAKIDNHAAGLGALIKSQDAQKGLN